MVNKVVYIQVKKLYGSELDFVWS